MLTSIELNTENITVGSTWSVCVRAGVCVRVRVRECVWVCACVNQTCAKLKCIHSSQEDDTDERIKAQNNNSIFVLSLDNTDIKWQLATIA